jgi:type IV pilus assembly protein PilW
VNNRLRRLTGRTYYIASCNDCVANDGIPTLKRVEMIDGALRTVSLAEGVENLQIEFGLDIDNDGRPDSFNTMGSGVITGAAPNVWENVVAIRLHLLSRSTEPTAGFVDARTYRLGPDITVVPAADRFKRTLTTTTVRLFNVGMRRE